MENYFCDGSTFRADGNCNKMVWKKSAARYKEIAEQRCKDLFKEIDVLNEQEDEQYKAHNLEETGSFSEPITREVIKEQATKLNQVIAKTTSTKTKRTAGRIKNQLQQEQEKITRYDNQIRKAGTRSGYNKTDTDASGMRMKNQETLPAYNVLAGCENQMIVNCSVHQNSNDSRCFKEHMAQLEQITDIVPGSVVADSIYGTEENYQLLEDKNIGNYLKYPAFHKEEKPLYKPEPFSSTEFNYNAGSNTYTCPVGRTLKFKRVHTEKRYSGYEITLKVYQCRNCRGCPFYEQCCSPRNETRRTLKINPTLEEHKKQARHNLRTEKGWELRKKRSIEIESCFGDIKHNMGIRRCHLRGLKKVHADFCYIAMAHNMRKIHLMNQKKAS